MPRSSASAPAATVCAAPDPINTLIRRKNIAPWHRSRLAEDAWTCYIQMYEHLSHMQPPERPRIRTGEGVFLVGAGRLAAAVGCQDSRTGDEPGIVRGRAASRESARPQSFGGGHARSATGLDQRAVLGVLARTLGARYRPGNTRGASSEIVRCRIVLSPGPISCPPLSKKSGLCSFPLSVCRRLDGVRRHFPGEGVGRVRQDLRQGSRPGSESNRLFQGRRFAFASQKRSGHPSRGGGIIASG